MTSIEKDVYVEKQVVIEKLFNKKVGRNLSPSMKQKKKAAKLIAYKV